MEAFLTELLRSRFPLVNYQMYSFQGKKDLLTKLPNRLQAFRIYSPPDYRIFILLDKDTDECRTLKEQAERMLKDAQILWEELGRIMQRAGHFKTGLRKIELAREMGKRIDPLRNRSLSFQRFYQVLLECSPEAG